jgi:hypothetical protein
MFGSAPAQQIVFALGEKVDKASDGMVVPDCKTGLAHDVMVESAPGVRLD